MTIPHKIKLSQNENQIIKDFLLGKIWTISKIAGDNKNCTKNTKIKIFMLQKIAENESKIPKVKNLFLYFSSKKS